MIVIELSTCATPAVTVTDRRAFSRATSVGGNSHPSDSRRRFELVV